METRKELEGVEMARLELEANVNKLRNSLQHWRKLEIDYDEFIEKLEAIEGEPSLEALTRVRNSIDATLITDHEAQELLQTEKGAVRNRDQIVGMLRRRVDYVRQNAESLQEQLESAMRDLSRLDGGGEDDFKDDEGLPITEILEELDDEGNVVASSTSTAQDAASGAARVLEHVGVKEWVDPQAEITEHGLGHSKSRSPAKADDAVLEAPTPDTSPALTPDTLAAAGKKRKKSVSFAPDISVSPSSGRRASSPPPLRSPSPPLSKLPPTPIKPKQSVPWEVEEARKGRFHSGTRVIEVDERDNEIASLPVVPLEDESPEDAALRREMTQYALGEVGAIVAEMDLEEDDDYYDGEGGPQGEGDEETENEFGMTAFNRISDEDRKQMLELEKKLNVRMLQNIGPQAGDGLTDIVSSDVPRLDVQSGAEPSSSTSGRRSSKVHFAEEEEFLPTPVERSSEMPPSSGANTVNIPIHMREQQVSEKTSPAAPEGPPGQTMSDNVIERTARESRAVPPDEHGADPSMLERELAIQNRQLLNKMVQRQGGFKPSPEEEDNPLMEEKDGKVRKVSRFKAARLNAEGL